MSVSGIINTHFIVAYARSSARHRGAEAALPARMATGGSAAPSRCRAGARLRMSRPSDQRPGTATDNWTITGQKMWLTNGGSANLVRRAGAQSTSVSPTPGTATRRPSWSRRSRLRHHRAGVTVPGKIDKMGYKGVDTGTRPGPQGATARSPGILGRVPGQGLLPDDGRRRGRPGQRRRAGLRTSPMRAASSSASPTPSSARPSARKIAEPRASLFPAADMATRSRQTIR